MPALDGGYDDPPTVQANEAVEPMLTMLPPPLAIICRPTRWVTMNAPVRFTSSTAPVLHVDVLEAAHPDDARVVDQCNRHAEVAHEGLEPDVHRRGVGDVHDCCVQSLPSDIGAQGRECASLDVETATR